MNWRQWVVDTLKASSALQAEVGNRFYGSGSLTESPTEVPFIVVAFIPNERRGPGRVLYRCQVWVHDRGGSYVRIDRILPLVTGAIASAVATEDFIGATWEGDSADGVDDAMNTKTRNVSFRLAAKE